MLWLLQNLIFEGGQYKYVCILGKCMADKNLGEYSMGPFLVWIMYTIALNVIYAQMNVCLDARIWYGKI